MNFKTIFVVLNQSVNFCSSERKKKLHKVFFFSHKTEKADVLESYKKLYDGQFTVLHDHKGYINEFFF